VGSSNLRGFWNSRKGYGNGLPWTLFRHLCECILVYIQNYGEKRDFRGEKKKKNKNVSAGIETCKHL
jgi:hypothetical protein